MLTSISGWSAGAAIDKDVLHEAERAGTRNGAPARKASAPSKRQASAINLAIMVLGEGTDTVKGCTWVTLQELHSSIEY